MPTTSPVHHALAVRELLFRIFLHSTTATNAVNARVCKLWSNEALSVNWYSIDADALLNLLKPEEASGLVSGMCIMGTDDLTDHSQCPFGIPGTEAWSRFDEYAWRVRVLSFRPSEYFPYIVLDQVLNMKSDRNRALVPNLTALSIVIFDEFFRRYSEPLETALTILKSAFFNMSSLHTFRVPGYDGEESSIVLQSFASIIGGFHQLEEVHIPAFWLTDPVVDSLASLQGLRSLEISTINAPFPAQFATIPPTSDNYFPALEKLRIDTSSSKAIKWFSHPRFPKTLTFLFIHLRQYEGHLMVDGCDRLLEVIGSRLCNLCTLKLRNFEEDRPSAARSFHILRPLLALADLQHVSLVTRFETTVHHSDLVALFKALPRLETLYIPISSPVDISCLAEIAPIAHRLETIELNWCTPPTHTVLRARTDIAFAQLKAMHGVLCCDLPPIAVAEFLEDVLPPECSISKTWDLVYDVRAAFARVREKERRRQARALGWVYVAPVGMGSQP